MLSYQRASVVSASMEGFADGDLVFVTDEDSSQDDSGLPYSGDLVAFVEAGGAPSTLEAVNYQELELDPRSISDYRELSTYGEMGPEDIFGEGSTATTLEATFRVAARKRFGTELWIDAFGEGEGARATGSVALLDDEGTALLLAEAQSWGQPGASILREGWLDAGIYTLRVDSTSALYLGPGEAGDAFTGLGFGFELFCDADINIDEQVNRADLRAFLDAASAGDPSADMDGDGAITGRDRLLFLRALGEGC